MDYRDYYKKYGKSHAPVTPQNRSGAGNNTVKTTVAAPRSSGSDDITGRIRRTPHDYNGNAVRNETAASPAGAVGNGAVSGSRNANSRGNGYGTVGEAASVRRSPSSEGGDVRTRTRVNNYVSNGAHRRRPGSAAAKSHFVKIAIIVLIVLLVVGIAVMAIMLISSSTPKYLASKITAEVGRKSISASDFILSGEHSAEFEEKTSYDLSQVGTYKIYLNVDGKSYTVKLKVADSVPPTGTPMNVTLRAGTSLEPSQCVKDIVDNSDVTVSFKNDPDFSVVGVHSVTLVLKDAGGNETMYEIKVNVVEHGAVLNQTVNMECGTAVPDVSAFVGSDGDTGAYYISDLSAIDTSVPGIYSLEIFAGGGIHSVTLYVEDTTPPVAVVTPQTVYNGGAVPPASAFVTDIRDASQVAVSYESAPVVGGSGSVPVRIVLTDRWGNRTVYDSVLNTAEDRMPPVIKVLRDRIELNAGEAIQWRSCVEVSDDSGNCDVILDLTGIDTKKPGSYNTYFIATDAAGNEARSHCTLIVHDQSVTQEMVDAAAARLEAELFRPGMTIYQKMYELYCWLSANEVGKLKYVNDSPHDDWRLEAYLVLTTTHEGDCFAYASVAMAVFNHMGYDCRLVERAPEYHAEGTHFWNLVNIGTAENPMWYHFDGTPQRGDFRVAAYAMTDAQVRAYTNWRNAEQAGAPNLNYYKYDTSLYPASAAQIVEKLSAIPAKYYN